MFAIELGIKPHAEVVAGSTRRYFEGILAKHGVAIGDLDDSDD